MSETKIKKRFSWVIEQLYVGVINKAAIEASKKAASIGLQADPRASGTNKLGRSSGYQGTSSNQADQFSKKKGLKADTKDNRSKGPKMVIHTDLRLIKKWKT